MDTKELRQALLDRGMPKEVLDNISDEELVAVSKLAEKISVDVQKGENGVKQIDGPDGKKWFEVETDYFRMRVPWEYFGFFTLTLSALMQTVQKQWESMPQAVKDKDFPEGPCGLAGIILGETAEMVCEYVHEQEGLMDELMMNETLKVNNPKKQYNDLMFG